LLAKVEEDDTERTAVIGVNDTSANVQKVLDGQTGTRRDASVGADRNGNGDVRGHQRFALSRNHHVGSTKMKV
jgi:hypothetical protein